MPQVSVNQESKEWYLAASKPRQEARAVENLVNQEINAYSPMMKVEKIRAGKRVVVEEAMFTGYIFVNLSPKDGLWHKVKSTRGVRDWVRFSGFAAQVPTMLVEKFINLTESELTPEFKAIYKTGDKVAVLEGPFKGLNGIYQAADGEARSIILIDFLGKKNQLIVKNEQIVID